MQVLKNFRIETDQSVTVHAIPDVSYFFFL